jgi:diacylglycerol kinase family enzyme
MMGRHAVLVNVHSRKIRKDPRFLAELRETFGTRGLFLTPKTPQDLPAAISEIRKYQTDLLFVCGGDGTIRQSVSELILGYGNQPLPKVAILKSGTMNTVATGLGIHRPALVQLRWILERCDRPRPLPSVLLHPLSIGDTYGFIFAIGGFSNFISSYDSVSDPTPFRGFWMLARMTISSILGTEHARSVFPPFSADIRKDGKPFLTRTTITTFSASAVKHIGFGFKPYAQAEGPAGDFGVLILKSLPRALVPHLLEIRRGIAISGPSIHQFAAREIQIQLDTEIAPMVDGDILEPRKEFALRVGPAVDFVTG